MSIRSEKVSKAIKKEVSLLLDNVIRDPRIGFVTITKVTITEDLRNAVIYYSVLGTEKNKKSAHYGLKSALPFIKKELAKILKLRFMPQIMIKYDDTLEYREKIDTLLDKIKKEINGGQENVN